MYPFDKLLSGIVAVVFVVVVGLYSRFGVQFSDPFWAGTIGIGEPEVVKVPKTVRVIITLFGLRGENKGGVICALYMIQHKQLARNLYFV